jgi:hypothetical protein
MPAPSSPCAASPAPAPSTTTATTPRRVRAWLHRLIALFVSAQRLTVTIFTPFPFRAPAAEVVGVSTAWIGRGLSCVCAQRRDSEARLSFDLTAIQVKNSFSFHSVMACMLSTQALATSSLIFYPLIARDHYSET